MSGSTEDERFYGEILIKDKQGVILLHHKRLPPNFIPVCKRCYRVIRSSCIVWIEGETYCKECAVLNGDTSEVRE